MRDQHCSRFFSELMSCGFYAPTSCSLNIVNLLIGTVFIAVSIFVVIIFNLSNAVEKIFLLILSLSVLVYFFQECKHLKQSN